MPPSFRRHADWPDDDAPALNAQDGTYLLDAPEDYEGLDFTRIRRPEPDDDPDPDSWLTASEMTQTEVSLRLARHLLAQQLVASEVSVALTGDELTRRLRPRFPVVRYLTERGFVPQEALEDWRGTYRLHDAAHPLRLHAEPDAGDVVATLAAGRRLVAPVSRGHLAATRSPAEHKLLRGAIARALTVELAEETDLLAAVVPRSKRFRELARRWRTADGVVRAGILILTVDRAGLVDGLPRDRQP